MRKAIAGINLVLAFAAVMPLAAHVLELPAKLALDGPLWLSIQQKLYRGWGPIFGPVEIAALVTSAWLYVASSTQRRLYLIAAICFALMLVCFFVFNDPVNRAFAGWTAATLPADWSRYRAKWETGHALSALLSVIAFVALLRASIQTAKADGEN